MSEMKTLEDFNVACQEDEIAAMPEWRRDELARKYAEDTGYGDPRQDYADDVGMPLHEKFRP